MVTTSKTLPITPDSKPSSWINQALHNRKLRSSVLVQGFFVGLGFLFGFWGGFRGFLLCFFFLEDVNVVPSAKAAAASNTNTLDCNGHSRSYSLMSARVQT